MENPLVSIIIPAYNAEKYIEETIQSALNSTYKPIEIVIVNDGSTDGTQKIADKFVESNNNVFSYFQENKGASSARNLAISKSQGDLILPLDSDNRISADYIEEAVKVLTTSPDVKLVSCEAEFIGEKSGKWNFQPFSLNLLCRRNLIDNCAMYRKADWEKVGGYCYEILGREDWDFWLSLFEDGGTFVRLPITGLFYRVRHDSKRVKTRHLHKEIIDLLNVRHKPLFYSELNGKLHYQRTHSKKINSLISLFRPQSVLLNTSNNTQKKWVYAANESNVEKEKLAVPKNVDYVEFSERRIHFPGSKIETSKARTLFDDSDRKHLGVYEEQVSPVLLKSYLIKLTSQ